MTKLIRVVLADDHGLILEGLCSLISTDPKIQVVATALDGEQLKIHCECFRPDVVITDIDMPKMDPIEVVPHIHQANPATKILLLSTTSSESVMQMTIKAGADGLLLKSDPPKQALQAIHQTLEGQLVFPAAARSWLFRAPQKSSRSEPLSTREKAVLALVAQGYTNAEIAQQLTVSINTIKFHLQNIYKTINVSNRTEASFWFSQQNV